MFFYGEAEFLEGSGGITEQFSLDGKTYRVHRFLQNGTLTIEYSGLVEYLIIGGGGGGGRGFEGSVGGILGKYDGNGGDAGQMISGSIILAAQSYPIIVGGFSVTSGNPSSAFNITAAGGAFKGSARNQINGVGASGGINGLQSSIDGTLKYYAGGGGAGGNANGGLGGGGRGGLASFGFPGIANTGAGGGGGERDRWGHRYYSKNGGAGASGIVIIRYEIA
jgi:hypothetical protein